MSKGRKTGGRKIGTQNKKTKQWNVFASYCMNGGLKKFQKEMNKLSGKDYVYAFINLLEFHKPKLARTETKIELPSETKITLDI